MKPTRRHAIAAAISMAAACASGLAWAADGYPAKQITLVVAYPADRWVHCLDSSKNTEADCTLTGEP